ncbi:MAG: hypothetical protein GY868_16445 [Deltaproteobacteria bacterium]|nr:hypothetical protein [Deltaproteobacteria bacterium]
MTYFWRFMGWLILYSFIYFLVLDIIGVGPGKENILLSIAVFLISFPFWWITWNKFNTAFSSKPPIDLGSGKKNYSFALRKTAMTYYLMILKLFLLVMGANGIITLDHHEGGWRTFYIWNFVILYVYAIPFFIIKCLKLKKGLAAKLIMDNTTLTLMLNKKSITEIQFNAIERVQLEESSLGMLIESSGSKLYIGGKDAGGSSFYLSGIEEIYKKLQEAPNVFEKTGSIKNAMKQISFKPAI